MSPLYSATLFVATPSVAPPSSRGFAARGRRARSRRPPGPGCPAPPRRRTACMPPRSPALPVHAPSIRTRSRGAAIGSRRRSAEARAGARRRFRAPPGAAHFAPAARAPRARPARVGQDATACPAPLALAAPRRRERADSARNAQSRGCGSPRCGWHGGCSICRAFRAWNLVRCRHGRRRPGGPRDGFRPIHARSQSPMRIQTRTLGRRRGHARIVPHAARRPRRLRGRTRVRARLARDDYAPFQWLLSFSDPELALPVLDGAARRRPTTSPRGRTPTVTPSARSRATRSRSTWSPTSSPRRGALTVNLRAPIVVHPATRLARQVVLSDGRYAIDHSSEREHRTSSRGGTKRRGISTAPWAKRNRDHRRGREPCWCWDVARARTSASATTSRSSSSKCVAGRSSSGIEAPLAIQVHREEIYERIQRQNRRAAGQAPADLERRLARAELAVPGLAHDAEGPAWLGSSRRRT